MAADHAPLADWHDPGAYPACDAPLERWGWEFLRRNPEYRDYWPGAYARFRELRECQLAEYRADPCKVWDTHAPLRADSPMPLPDGLTDSIRIDTAILWPVMARAGERDQWGLRELPCPEQEFDEFPCARPALGPTPDGSPRYVLEISPWDSPQVVKARAAQLLRDARSDFGLTDTRARTPHWTRYLRLLDAEAAGADRPAIRLAFYKGTPASKAAKKRHDDLEAASAMRDGGWRFLLR